MTGRAQNTSESWLLPRAENEYILRISELDVLGEVPVMRRYRKRPAFRGGVNAM